MKQGAKLIGCLVIILCLTTPVLALKGPSDVAETVHNMSLTTDLWNQYATDNVDEVCVFCHTPHGGNLTGPLWNRSLPGVASFTHYNSATLSTYLQGLQVSRDIGEESLLCMSCHDGSVAITHLINDPNSLNGAAITVNGNPDRDIVEVFGAGARIGATNANTTATGDLSDDHPISFSYPAVQGQIIYGPGGSRDGELNDVSTATTAGVRFFGSASRVECSSCHDPHVSYDQWAIPPGDESYRPFLIMPNTGSGLCLACHNK